MFLQNPAKTIIKSLLFLEKQGSCQPCGEEAVNPWRGGFLQAGSTETMPQPRKGHPELQPLVSSLVALVEDGVHPALPNT